MTTKARDFLHKGSITVIAERGHYDSEELRPWRDVGHEKMQTAAIEAAQLGRNLSSSKWSTSRTFASVHIAEDGGSASFGQLPSLVAATAIFVVAGGAFAQQTEFIALDVGFQSAVTRAEVRTGQREAYAGG